MKKFFLLACAFVVSLSSAPAFADASVEGVPAIDQDIFERVLRVNNICGPTTFTEIVGFWGNNGYPDLLEGPLSGQVPDTSQGMIDLFELGMDYSGWTGNVTYPNPFAQGMKEYFNDSGYDVEVTHWRRGAMGWYDLTAELDAGRPVALLVWSWQHWVVATGYTDRPRSLTVLYGHVPLVRTYYASRYPYIPRLSGIEAIFVQPIGNVAPIPDPEPTPVVDPSIEPWYQAVMEWCSENGWELEPVD